ncbi:hypothetical protein OIV83_006481 [Microbotryomycetes sp. JL201]|nr:hypothetical protein OIV83_006481 [Microbotryomycetes sp. JL201]
MDQEAFRALLASNTATRSGPKQRLGTAPSSSKRTPATNASATTLSSSTATEFKPRKTHSKNPQKDVKQKSSVPPGYRDRAAERRSGKDGDFTQAEKLLEASDRAFEHNQGVDEETFKEQMKYLGGDAEHSILVKGLDMALLEREKAKQANESDVTLEQVEDELDRALLEKAEKRTKKRTRDDLIAELKARAASGSAGADVEADRQERKSKPTGFKPIGWKAVESAEPEKKKKKKKKKKVVQQDETKDEVAPAVAPTAGATEPKTEPSRPLPTTLPTIDVEDDDFDIFGGAGDYKGMDTDSDSDNGAKTPRPAPEVSSTTTEAGVKRKYFDDDDDDDMTRTTAPTTVTQLASNAAVAAAAASTSHETGDGENEDDETSSGTRLQPLAGSAIPSVRDLLDMDDAAEKEEKRKQRKAHYQMKAAERKQAALDKMTPAEKAEHEHQVMMAYLEKKSRKGGGATATDDADGVPEM